MKTQNLGMAALISAAALAFPASATAGGDEAEYEAEADARVCVISIVKTVQKDGRKYKEYVAPYGDPRFDTEYLSLQGDFDDDWLPGGDNQPVRYASGKAKAKAKSHAAVISGGLVQWQDLNDLPLGDGQDLFFGNYGASLGLGGRSSYAWRYQKDDWDDNDWRKGRRGACGGDEIIRVSAKAEGEVAAKRKYGPAESLSDAFAKGFLYIDNSTGHTLTFLVAMDYRYCVETERAYGANVHASASIGVEGVQGYFGPLFDPLTADTSYRREFCRKGTKYAKIDVPGSFFEGDNYQAFLITVNAAGGANMSW